jgi:hypothetical protein
MIAAVPVLAVVLAMASDGRRVLRPRFVQRMDELYDMGIDAGAIVPGGKPDSVGIRRDALQDWFSALIETRSELRRIARDLGPESKAAVAWKHSERLVGTTASLLHRSIEEQSVSDIRTTLFWQWLSFARTIDALDENEGGS